MPTEADIRFMKRAIELGREVSLERGQAGPFGCVVVKDGEVVAEGVNRVLSDGDPTAHGEMVALREACRALGTHDLSGCVVYSSSEPCPMCYAACWWARVDAIRCASTVAILSFSNKIDSPVANSSSSSTRSTFISNFI